jgi:hypothetical protein
MFIKIHVVTFHVTVIFIATNERTSELTYKLSLEWAIGATKIKGLNFLSLKLESNTSTHLPSQFPCMCRSVASRCLLLIIIIYIYYLLKKTPVHRPRFNRNIDREKISLIFRTRHYVPRQRVHEAFNIPSHSQSSCCELQQNCYLPDPRHGVHTCSDTNKSVLILKEDSINIKCIILSGCKSTIFISVPIKSVEGSALIYFEGQIC